MQAVNVLCIKWGHKYGPEYVDKLYAMVHRHLRRPFRFVCLTDDPEGIDRRIETKPIPMVGFPEFDTRQAWTFAHGWLKLTLLADPLHDLRGRTLFLDLDIVIVDSIDCLFDQPGEFCVIKEWTKKDATGNTSVFLYTVGAHADVLRHLTNNYPSAMSKVRNEQEFITLNLSRQGKISYWPAPWCVSFKRHCVPRGLLNWVRPPSIPAGAKIIAFHGKPNPPDAIKGVSGKWYRRVPPTQWVADHWR